MKKFFKITGIAIAVVFGILFIIGIIFDESGKAPETKEKANTSNFEKLKKKLETVDDSTTFNAYFNEIEEIAKTDTAAKAFLKYKPDYKFSMQQRALAKWVEYAKKEFKKQFAAADGSNAILVYQLKKVMNDPNSFKHVETKWEYGSQYKYIRVQMTYRGKNAFNATITETVTAKIDVKGNILEIE